MTQKIVRRPIQCSEHLTPAGKAHTMAVLGINSQGRSGIWFWCRLCRREHFLSLDHMQAALTDLHGECATSEQPKNP